MYYSTLPMYQYFVGFVVVVLFNLKVSIYVGLLVAEDEETIHQLPFQPFNGAAQARKRFLCTACTACTAAKPEPEHRCECTFGKRFFDRWTCLRCHLHNWIKMKTIASALTLSHPIL
jgi:hypothetical protein